MGNETWCRENWTNFTFRITLAIYLSPVAAFLSELLYAGPICHSPFAAFIHSFGIDIRQQFPNTAGDAPTNVYWSAAGNTKHESINDKFPISPEYFSPMIYSAKRIFVCLKHQFCCWWCDMRRAIQFHFRCYVAKRIYRSTEINRNYYCRHRRHRRHRHWDIGCLFSWQQAADSMNACGECVTKSEYETPKFTSRTGSNQNSVFPTKCGDKMHVPISIKIYGENVQRREKIFDHDVRTTACANDYLMHRSSFQPSPLRLLRHFEFRQNDSIFDSRARLCFWCLRRVWCPF